MNANKTEVSCHIKQLSGKECPVSASGAVIQRKLSVRQYEDSSQK